MLTALLVVLPIFGVIAAGYCSGRAGLLGPTAGSELNRFVVYLALPALLFEVMAKANWADLRQPGFIAAFSIGALSVYCCSLIFRMARGKTLAQASMSSVASFVHLLGSAASPCALISLGLFLSARRNRTLSARSTAAFLSAMKLIAQPAITAVCVYWIFGLSGVSAAVAVLISALPTGTRPFMVAELYDIEASTTSYTILYSTTASVITLAVCLALLARQ